MKPSNSLIPSSLAMAVLLLSACQGASQDLASKEFDTRCAEPRPEVCTFEYNPVCALEKRGGDDTAWVTHGNGCTACSQASVLGHRPGACENASAEETE